MTFETSAVIVTWAAIVLLGLAMSGIIRQVRYLSHQMREARLPIGTMAGVMMPSIDGESWTDRASVLLFATPDCQVCVDRFDDLNAIAAHTSPGIGYFAIFSGPWAGRGTARIRTFESQEVIFSQLGIPVSPFGAVVSRGGVITHARPLGSREALEDVIAVAKGVAG